MNGDASSPSLHFGGITIESDRRTTLWMAALFLICGLLLAQEIYQATHGHFLRPGHLRINFSSIFNKVFEVIVSVYCFMAAYRFPKKSVQVGFGMFGINFAVFVLLSFVHTSPGLRSAAAFGGSALRQVALVIFCVAIAEWFRSTVHREMRSGSEETESDSSNAT